MIRKLSKARAYFLWFFLGLFGIHNFYVQEKIKGIIKLSCILLFIMFGITSIYILVSLTLITIIVLWLIDCITLSKKIDKMNDKLDNQELSYKEKNNLNSTSEMLNLSQSTKRNEEITVDEGNKDHEENTVEIENMMSKNYEDKRNENLEKLKKMISSKPEFFGEYNIYQGDYELILVLSNKGHLDIIGEPYNKVFDINKIKNVQFCLDLSKEIGIICYRLLLDDSLFDEYTEGDPTDSYIDIIFDFFIKRYEITGIKKEKFEKFKLNFLKVKEDIGESEITLRHKKETEKEPTVVYHDENIKNDYEDANI